MRASLTNFAPSPMQHPESDEVKDQFAPALKSIADLVAKVGDPNAGFIMVQKALSSIPMPQHRG